MTASMPRVAFDPREVDAYVRKLGARDELV